MLRTNQSFLAYAKDLYDLQERKEDIVISYTKGQRLLSQNETAAKVMLIQDGITKCFFTENNDKGYILPIRLFHIRAVIIVGTVIKNKSMSEYIKIGLKITWLLVLTYWLSSGLRAKKAEHQETIFKRFAQYWLPLIIAILLLGPGDWYGHGWLREQFVAHTNLVGTIGLLISIIGAIIACTSRYLLGKNWSLSVQRKEGHQLIQNGMYKIIRHPIYTGLLLLFIGNAIIVGDYRGIIAVLIVFVSLWLKFRKEEKLLTEIFGTEYTEYKNRTKALVPYLL